MPPASLLLVAFLALPVASLYQQSVAVKGKLLCGWKPLRGTSVKLWNKNTLGRDDLLDSTITNGTGHFELWGGVGGLFKMNVKYKVYHECQENIKPCKRKVTLRVQDSFVTRSSKPEMVFDAGTLNMDAGTLNKGVPEFAIGVMKHLATVHGGNGIPNRLAGG